MSTRNVPEVKVLPARKADNLTAICELSRRIWEPRHLTILWNSTACYRDSFTLTNFIIRLITERGRKVVRTRWEKIMASESTLLHSTVIPYEEVYALFWAYISLSVCCFFFLEKQMRTETLSKNCKEQKLGGQKIILKLFWVRVGGVYWIRMAHVRTNGKLLWDGI
jgi:hypothetical protein